MDSLRLTLLIIGLVVIAGIYLWETRGKRRRGSPVEDEFDTGYLDELSESRVRKDFGYTRSSELSTDSDFHTDNFSSADATEKFAIEQDKYVEGEGLSLDSDKIILTDFDPRSAQIPISLEPEVQKAISSLERITPKPLPGRLGEEQTSNTEEMVVSLTIMSNEEEFCGDTVFRVLTKLCFKFGDMNLFHQFGRGVGGQHLPICSVANVICPGSFADSKLSELQTPGLAIFARLTPNDAGLDIIEALIDVGQAIAVELNGQLCDQSRNVLSKQSINHLHEQIVDFMRKYGIRH